MIYETIEQAQEALNAAALDVAADRGEDAVEAAWTDIVSAIAALCTSEVARELAQREGVSIHTICPSGAATEEERRAWRPY